MATETPSLIVALAKKKVRDALPKKGTDAETVAKDILKAIEAKDVKALASALQSFETVSGGDMTEE